MAKSKLILLTGAVAVAVTLVVLLVVFSKERPEISIAKPAPATTPKNDANAIMPLSTSNELVSREDYLASLRKSASVGTREVVSTGGAIPEGTVLLQEDTNPSVAGVIQALESGTKPERLSPTVLPEPFDETAYRADPMAYAQIVEPGRVWQSAQPGPGVFPIRRVAPMRTVIKQRESVRLTVLAKPGAPVTFTSFDLGVFANSLPSQTVIASDKGVAEAVFTGTVGTLYDVQITAASPLNSGRANFVVHVLPPSERELPP